MAAPMPEPAYSISMGDMRCIRMVYYIIIIISAGCCEYNFLLVRMQLSYSQ